MALLSCLRRHSASIRVSGERHPLFLYLAHQAVHSANTYSPLQAPPESVSRFRGRIPDENRRRFAGMLWEMDASLGRLMETLAEEDMLRNSVVAFTTDNGGPAAGFDQNYASNWPLRGVRGGAFSSRARLLF